MPDKLRVLFCLGVLPATLEADGQVQAEIMEVLKTTFADLKGDLGVEVLGTMDDDQLQVGPSTAFPWTAYILADAPDLASVVAVCDLLRQTEAPAGKLWRYLKIEARVGRPLFFANP